MRARAFLTALASWLTLSFSSADWDVVFSELNIFKVISEHFNFSERFSLFSPTLIYGVIFNGDDMATALKKRGKAKQETAEVTATTQSKLVN